MAQPQSGGLFDKYFFKDLFLLCVGIIISVLCLLFVADKLDFGYSLEMDDNSLEAVRSVSCLDEKERILELEYLLESETKIFEIQEQYWMEMFESMKAGRIIFPEE